MMKRISAIMAAILLVLCLPVIAFAETTVITQPAGSITVKVVYDGTALEGLKLTAFRVGELVKQDDAEASFQRVLVRKSLDAQIKADPKGLADELWTFMRNNSHMSFYKQTAVADQNGNISFLDCSPGVYLIVQEEDYSLNGITYDKLNHFLVTVPYDGKYEVDVTGKVSLDVYNGEDAPTPTTSQSPSGSGGRLPQTGQTNWPVPVLSISGMFLFVVGWLLFRSEEKDAYEA